MVTRRAFLASASATVTLPMLGAGACTTYRSFPESFWLTPEQVKSDIDLANNAYSRIHPGYTRYASSAELEAGWSDIIDTASTDKGMSLSDFYLGFQKNLVRIRCDHTKAELPAALRQHRTGNGYYLPFRWTLIENRGFITELPSGSPLNLGDEILSIDGRTLDEIVASVSKYIPVDGYSEWSRRAGVSESFEFMGGAVDHFGTLLWGAPKSARVQVRSRDAQIRRYRISRISFEEWTVLGNQNGPAANFKDAVNLQDLGNGIALLSVDTFVNYREPVNPEDIYGPIFEEIKRIGYQSLILDLRKNGGGSTDASHGLVSYLIEEQLKIKTDMRVATIDFSGLRDAIETWEPGYLDPNPDFFTKNEDSTYSLKPFVSDELAPVTPSPNAFTGSVYILSGDQNSSGSTNIIAVLQNAGRAVVVGEKTGGSALGPTAGVMFYLNLPESGIRSRLPVIRYTNNVSPRDPGFGVFPDIETPTTVSAFLDGKDVALNAAIKAAKSA